MPDSFFPTVSDVVNPPENVVPIPNQQNEDEQDKFFDFAEARKHLQRLVDDWKTECEDTEVRRRERKVQVDVEDLRQRGDLDEDETIVPRRIIDTNIRREAPAYVNYIKNSRRLIIMTCDDQPDLNCDLAEQDFTKLATYEAWETPHFKCIDGSEAHGWDSVEVVFDESKPGKFALEQIGHDRLFFPRTTVDLQKCPRVVRGFDVTILQLQDFINRYGFDSNEVGTIRDAIKSTQKEAETVRIYKLFFKKYHPETKKPCVYVGWFSLEHGVKDWLSAPTKLYMGIDERNPQTQQWQPSDVTYYPIFLNIYLLNEEVKITESKGRCFYDGPVQEAMTALWSSFVNGMNRASNIYGAPAQEDGSGTGLKELEGIKMRSGRILSRPMQFWHPDYPDALVLKTLQHSDVQTADENNQVNFAAINREDSRKTAKEISAAENQQQLINSVQLTLYSTFIRQIYSFCWLIVKSQAAQGKIYFLRKPFPKLNPMNPALGPMIDPQTQQPIMEIRNDVEFLQHQFTIRAAGDVDVVQAEETAQRMQQDWQLISQTPLSQPFLIDYIKLRYPDKADRYSQVLAQQDQMMQQRSLIAQFTTVLNGLMQDHPEDFQGLAPEEKSQLAQMMQQGQQFTGENPKTPTQPQ